MKIVLAKTAAPWYHPRGRAIFVPNARKTAAMARLLLIDDDASTRSICKLFLNELGHDVCSAGTISEALNLADRDDIDLALADLMLPDGSAESVIGAFRFPAIALTGYDDPERSRRAGFVAHLTKPVDLDRLAAAISQALSRRTIPAS